jgi:hypothetical protein
VKLIAAPTIATVALLFALDSTSTARPTHKTPAKCPPAHAHVLIADEQARVYGGYLEDIYGCADGGTHPQDLGPFPIGTPEGFEGIEYLKLAGSIVAYTETFTRGEGFGPPYAGFFITVRNLRTGKMLHNVPTGPPNKIEPNNNSGSGSAQAIVVKSDGSVAWIAGNSEKYTKNTSYYELHIIDKSGGQTIAAGTEINPKSLALAGSTLYWTQGGKPMSAPLE